MPRRAVLPICLLCIAIPAVAAEAAVSEQKPMVAPADWLAKVPQWRQSLDKPVVPMPPAPKEGPRCRVEFGFRISVVGTAGTCGPTETDLPGLLEGEGQVWASYAQGIQGYLVARHARGVPQGPQIGLTSDGQFWIADWQNGRIVRLLQWFPWGHRFEGAIHGGSRDGPGVLRDAGSGFSVDGVWRFDRLLRGRIALNDKEWVEVESREESAASRLVVTASNRETLKTDETLPDDIARPLRLLPVLPARSPVIKAPPQKQ